MVVAVICVGYLLNNKKNKFQEGFEKKFKNKRVYDNIARGFREILIEKVGVFRKF